MRNKKCKSKRFRILKMLGAAMAMLGPNIPQAWAADVSCFSGQRFPKVIEGS